MKRYLIVLAMLYVMAGTAMGTMWLYDDPAFFQVGSSIENAALKSAESADTPSAQIVGTPYYPLLGQGFYKDAIPFKLTNNADAIQIGSKGPGNAAPVSLTFGGHLENNLRYAQSKSSLKIGPQGSWTTLNTPGAM